MNLKYFAMTALAVSLLAGCQSNEPEETAGAGTGPLHTGRRTAGPGQTVGRRTAPGTHGTCPGQHD